MFQINNETKKKWGKEVLLVNNDLYCAKYLYINKGYQTSIHYHEVKDEALFVMNGLVNLQLYPIMENIKYYFTKKLGKKQYYRIKINEVHRFCAIESDVVLLEVSTHHEDKDSKRLEIGGKIK